MSESEDPRHKEDPTAEALLRWLKESPVSEKLAAISSIGFLLALVHLVSWSVWPEIDIHAFLSAQDYLRISISWVAKASLMLVVAFVVYGLPDLIFLRLLFALDKRFSRELERVPEGWATVIQAVSMTLPVALGMFLLIMSLRFLGLPPVLVLLSGFAVMPVVHLYAFSDFYFKDYGPERLRPYRRLAVGSYLLFAIFFLALPFSEPLTGPSWSAPVTIELDDERYVGAQLHFVLDGFIIFRSDTDSLIVIPRSRVRAIRSLAAVPDSVETAEPSPDPVAADSTLADSTLAESP